MQHSDRDQLIKEIVKQYKPVLSKSSQCIYIYLDDTHRVCNSKFAELLGYDSVEEWISNKNPTDDISKEDREKEEKAYFEAVDNLKAVNIPVKYQSRDGKKVPASVIMCPATYKKEIFVIHFISKLV